MDEGKMPGTVASAGQPLDNGFQAGPPTFGL
jgi:hypothetical protein